MLSKILNKVDAAVYELPPPAADLLVTANNRVLETLGPLWPGQYLGAPWPTQIPHRRASGPSAPVLGFGRRYYEDVIQDRTAFLDFVERQGIVELAEQNGGICSFRLGGSPALYISDNEHKNNFIRAGQAILSPFQDRPILASRALITKPTADPEYHRDRVAIEKNLGAAAFRERGMAGLAASAGDSLARLEARGEMSLFDFALHLILDVESRIPGILDMHATSLAELVFRSEASLAAYKDSLVAIVDYLHEGKLYPKHKSERFQAHLVELFDDCVRQNFEHIRDAPDSNVIQQWFRKHLRRPFPTRIEAFDELLAAAPEARVNLAMDMGIVFFVGMFANTVNSLIWTLWELHRHPQVEARVRAEAEAADAEALSERRSALRALQYTQDAILENVRLHPPVVISGGKVTRGYAVELDGRRTWVPKGTVLFADLARCNQDPRAFPDPYRFNPENIAVARRERNTMQFLYTDEEYASFGGGSRMHPNAHDTPGASRKCPGRIYTVMIQSAILSALYGDYELEIEGGGGDDELRTVITYPIKDARVRLRARA